MASSPGTDQTESEAHAKRRKEVERWRAALEVSLKIRTEQPEKSVPMRRVPTTAAAGAELVPLFRDHLKLCNVQPGETVLGFTDTMSNEAYVTALAGAARVLGADFFQIVVAADESWMKSQAIIDAWRGQTWWWEC